MKSNNTLSIQNQFVSWSVPILIISGPVESVPDATSYRPDKNGFVKQQIRRGIGPADTLTQLYKGNSPGRYVNGIYIRVRPQQLSDQMGPDKS